ncbi:MAG: hypothetical protein JWQ40_3031 [Segetibacter sp.]|nr:hypothetical protein [Segetibacter sp.]
MKNSIEEKFYEDEDFDNMVYDDKHITGTDFSDCRFYKSSLKGCLFEECNFENCTFEDCDLSLIKFKRTCFSDGNIINCKAIGINWSEVVNALSVNFKHSRISFSGFFGKNLKKSQFTDCVADEVDFTDCNLSQSVFTGTDLCNARFENTDLTKADFAGAKNYLINTKTNKIKGAKFSLPEALSLLKSLDIVLVE